MSGKARKYSTIVALAALIVAGWMIRNQGFRAKNSRASSFHTGRSDLAAGRIGQDSRDFSLYNLLAVPPDELEHIDIALMNLICAQDLKGSEACDIEACLRNLDEWAGQIEEDTKARTKAYYRNPDRYNNSLNMFKVDGEWIEECTDYATMIPIVELAEKPTYLPRHLYWHERSTVFDEEACRRRDELIRRLLAKMPMER